MADIPQAIKALYPDAEFSGPKGGLGYEAVRWIRKPSGITEGKVLTKIAELQAAEPIRLLRIERNVFLAETDWMAFKDVTLPAAWKTYRQKLRDLPATANPTLDENGSLTNVTWPTKPE